MRVEDGTRQVAVGLRGHRVRDPEHAEERRRQILAGAAQVFGRKGYQAASMEDIAQEAGLAKGHIYHYFTGKEEIFTQIRATSVRHATEELECIVAEDAPPEATLRKALSALVAGAFEPTRQHATVLADPPDLSPGNRQRIRKLQRRYEIQFVGIIERGIDDGTFVRGDPKLMMFTLIRAALGVAIWYRPNGPWRPEWVTVEVTDQLVRSVLAR